MKNPPFLYFVLLFKSIVQEVGVVACFLYLSFCSLFTFLRFLFLFAFAVLYLWWFRKVDVFNNISIDINFKAVSLRTHLHHLHRIRHLDLKPPARKIIILFPLFYFLPHLLKHCPSFFLNLLEYPFSWLSITRKKS